ncbi:MAG: GyrI-like domain-containing protein [Bacillaceae bacterium]
MAGEKVDYKKQYKDLYIPKQKPALIDVPPMNFIMVDGKGEPAGECYQQAMQILYFLTFTIKMSKMSGQQPDGYFEYVVPPLEGLWWSEGGKLDVNQPKSEWLWTSMIRQPEFVTPEVFQWAVEECKRKKPDIDVSKARFESFSEGICVQVMHIGPYTDEQRSIDKIAQFIEDNQLIDMTGYARKHHEIYLSDPRRTASERLKTVLRFPVAYKGE